MQIIGKIVTPFQEGDVVPRQSVALQQTKGKIEILHEFQVGLKGLEKFSHIFAIFQFDRNDSFHLNVKPYLRQKRRGLFATRSPHRPSGIGLSIYKIEKIEDNVIYVNGVDVLDNTPLLDIKPYVPEIDIIKDAEIRDL